jgi:hypothetical protein
MTITNQERFVELSLAKKEYSGSATKYVPAPIHVSSLEATFKSNNYSPIVWRDHYRKSDNFSYATGFCLDIDNGMTIDAAEAILKDKNLNYALITTRSHTSSAHRFRILIPFNKKLYTYTRYNVAAVSIDKVFGFVCDKRVFDGGRQLYGSPDDACYSACWTGNDFDVTDFTGIDLSFVSSGHGDWDDNLIVTNKDGKKVSVKDIKEKTQIYCPWHDDKHSSAFMQYADQRDNWFIHCSSCDKTFWKTKTPRTMDDRCEHYWSHGSKIYEMGIIGDFYHFKEIGEKKFYTFVDAYEKERPVAYQWLLKNHHISNVIRIDYVGDPLAKEHSYKVKQDEGLIEVKYTAIQVGIQDNQFIENYLDSTFGKYKEFIKQYMAVYAYTDFKKLPTLIIVGKRGVGKNKFAEMMAEIYPQRSQFWTAKEESFNTELQKKLLIADETVSDKKENYLYLKRISGQNQLPINEKFTPKYQVKNNVNVIILSNNLLPIFVEREELPSSPANNQFFVYEMKPFEGALDAQLDMKLKARLGHFVRTELKQVFDGLDLSKNRYSIPVPITPDEHKLFKSSVSLEQLIADKFLQDMISIYSLGRFMELIQAGYLPVDSICDDLKITKMDKRSIVHNLREREYVAADDVVRRMVNGNREYCYLATEKLKTKIAFDNKIACIAQNGEGQQAIKTA